jgi:hypothetical protein
VRRGLAFLLLYCVAAEAHAADWPTKKAGEAASWDAAYDAGAGTRFIPFQLIVPGVWNGARTIDLPKDVEFKDEGGDRWSGPVADKDAADGHAIVALKRERRTPREGYVGQRFAVRAEQDGLGRVWDSRFGEIACAGEIKFPLGVWKQGETRINEYFCRGPSGRDQKRINTIVIEKLDYDCRGIPHCLQFTWMHIIDGRSKPDDYRRYVFAPGVGEILHDRLQ